MSFLATKPLRHEGRKTYLVNRESPVEAGRAGGISIKSVHSADYRKRSLVRAVVVYFLLFGISTGISSAHPWKSRFRIRVFISR